MAFTDNGNNTGMYMPVAPMGYGMNPMMYGGMNGMGFGNGWGYEGMWWIIILFLICGWGWGGNNGNRAGGSGGYGGGVDTLAIGSIGGSSGYREALQNGFDQQNTMMTLDNINTGMNSGFAGVQNALCNGFNGVNSNISNGFASAEISANNRQMANMQQQFNTQTAITAALNGIQAQQADCCCEQRLATANLNSTILSEDCATRATVTNGINQLLVNENNNTQRLIDNNNQGIQTIMDKICQLEIAGIKQNYENRIETLQNALTEARLSAQSLATSAARTAQTAEIIANNNSQTLALEQYLAPPARPAWVVPNPNANYGTGCYNNYYTGCCGNAA